MELPFPSENLAENQLFCVERFRRVHEFLSRIIPPLESLQEYQVETHVMADLAVIRQQMDRGSTGVQLVGMSGLRFSWSLTISQETDRRDNSDVDIRLQTPEGFVMRLIYFAMDLQYNADQNAEWAILLSEDEVEPEYFKLFVKTIEQTLGVPELFCDNWVSEADAFKCIPRMAEFFLENHKVITTAQSPCA